ncbi:MAG: hypothetical protein GTO30_22395 [Acidobacteria bacterium]|nr:hypothetical protein [Acidobacteriota bacterium]NIM64301.1 hypothetical protein [Acidobacteriota bacterium]NIO60933.1 hypothetical protein [Acidobacteriota bacterium]NIQ87402.1 hypothetical protein [Acidobacteriota bacterium]NIT12587.1 hypothetical protein [Acidobacteriota bacterium]
MLLLLAAAALGTPRADEPALAVVVNPGVEVDELSFAELRKIMLGDRQFWTSGQRITLIVRAPVADERTAMLESIYRMSEAQFRQYWIAKVFRAEATSGPRVVVSNDEAVDLVGVIEGGIAVVALSDVPEGIKVLRIDGKMPREPGYLGE